MGAFFRRFVPWRGAVVAAGTGWNTVQLLDRPGRGGLGGAEVFRLRFDSFHSLGYCDGRGSGVSFSDSPHVVLLARARRWTRPVLTAWSAGQLQSLRPSLQS